MKNCHTLLAAVAFVAIAGCVCVESQDSVYPSEIDEGFVSLFNGKDLTGWEGATMMYGVSEKELAARATSTPRRSTATSSSASSS